MKTNRYLITEVLSLLAVTLLALPSLAAVPDHTITVSPAAPSTNWMPALPAVGANVLYNPKTGEPCGKTPADYCDITLLYVDAAPSYWQQKIGGVLLSVFNTDGANFDLYVYQSDATATRGPLVASANHRRFGQPQTTPPYVQESTAILRASGYYLLHVVYTDAPGSTFTGEARLVPPSEWTPKIGALTLGMIDQRLDEAPSPYDDFTGLIDSFDGLTLATRIRIPFGATQPLPTVLLLGAFPRPRGAADILGPVANLVLPPRGYVAVSYSTRGVLGSCALFDYPPPTGPSGFETPRGPGEDPATQVTCVRGWTHLFERDFETRDSQRILGVLVDYGIADPDRLAAAGVSGGGNESWMLATSLPWDSTTLAAWGSSRPVGKKLQLIAAIPLTCGTDFLSGLVPNGRASDGIDQSRSHEVPFGIVKQSLASGFLAPFIQWGMRMNTLEPAELHSFGLGWLPFWEAGEPYETSRLPVDTDASHDITAASLAAAFRNKSAYYATEYFDAVKTGIVRPVPVFAVQGWTDAVFPAVELLQMYRKLKAADANYPIWMVLADYSGHPNTQHPNKFNEGNDGKGQDLLEEDLQRKARDFLDAFLGTNTLAIDPVVSFVTEPIPMELRLQGKVPPLPQWVAGPDWDGMHPGTIQMLGDDRPRTTTSTPPNAAEETPTDPNAAGGPGAYFIITQSPGTYVDIDDWKCKVDDFSASGFTLLGLPTLRINQEITGEDATVIAKLWDVDQLGTRTLVTRGLYRLSLAAGDPQNGAISFQLFGNHWKFQPGHSIHLEISQTDAPFLRPNNLPSTITWSSPELALPTVEQIGN